MLFSGFFAGLLLFSPKGSVTGCDSLLGSFCHSPVYVLLFAYASSFRLLLLRLCNNRCAEALGVYQKFSFGGLNNKNNHDNLICKC